jgi:hypothetical protein
MPYYIHKHEISLENGGPEEGGWNYTAGSPVEDWVPLNEMFDTEEEAYHRCRELNEQEFIRAKEEEDYAYRSTHYGYSVEDTPVMQPFPLERPFYE